MIDKLIFVLTQKLAILFVASLTTVGGFLAISSGNHNHLPLPQTAIVVNTIAIANITNFPDIAPDLLPTTTIPFCTASSTCGIKNIRVLIRTAATENAKKTTASAPTTITAAAIVQTPQVVPAAPSPTPTAPATSVVSTASTALQPLTAQGILANVTPSFQETRTGPYEITINASGQNSGNLSWNIGAQNVGGTTSNPQFASSFSCDPVAQTPAPGALDQNPLFETDTAYNCTLSLTPLTGDDRTTQSKNISFTTPAGQLFVTPAAAMDTLLVDNTNNGGIVFNNEDASPVTVTGLTFNVSYADLDTLNGPLVFRLLDPTSTQSLFDYHLENAPGDQATITAPASLTISGMNQEMLPIQILGVDRMLAASTTPSVNVTLQGVTTNRSDIKVNIFDMAQVSWSCTVPNTGYDPNATSGPFATGQACGN